MPDRARRNGEAGCRGRLREGDHSPPSPSLALAAAGDRRVGELGTDLNVVVDSVAELAERVADLERDVALHLRVLERALASVYRFADQVREAVSSRSAEQAYDASFDLRAATDAHLDDLRGAA